MFFILAKYQVSSNHIHTYVLGHQNENNFNLGGVAINFMKFTSLNFKIIFPRFKDTAMVATLSFFLIGFIYFLGNKLVKNNSEQTEKFNLFFILGIISSLFLAIMSINIKSYSPFYYRYFTFSIPFIALFLAHFIQIMSNKYNNKAITTAIFLMLFLPNAYFYVGFLIKNNTVVRYNHITIAQEIVSKNITNVELPEWEDAFLIQSFLPSGYDLDFTLNKTSPNFTLSNATIHEQFLVIKQKN